MCSGFFHKCSGLGPYSDHQYLQPSPTTTWSRWSRLWWLWRRHHHYQGDDDDYDHITTNRVMMTMTQLRLWQRRWLLQRRIDDNDIKWFVISYPCYFVYCIVYMIFRPTLSCQYILYCIIKWWSTTSSLCINMY